MKKKLLQEIKISRSGKLTSTIYNNLNGIVMNQVDEYLYFKLNDKICFFYNIKTRELKIYQFFTDNIHRKLNYNHFDLMLIKLKQLICFKFDIKMINIKIEII